MDARLFFRRVARHFACDEQRADAVTFAVFQELRDRLTPAEAADVAAQLPPPLRRLWEENERADRTVRRTHAREFLGLVRRRLDLPSENEALRAVEAVFRELQILLGSPTGQEGEAWDVLSQLPKDLKKIWIDAARIADS